MSCGKILTSPRLMIETVAVPLDAPEGTICTSIAGRFSLISRSSFRSLISYASFETYRPPSETKNHTVDTKAA